MAGGSLRGGWGVPPSPYRIFVHRLQISAAKKGSLFESRGEKYALFE